MAVMGRLKSRARASKYATSFERGSLAGKRTTAAWLPPCGVVANALARKNGSGVAIDALGFRGERG
jgi:hypothetical protein